MTPAALIVWLRHMEKDMRGGTPAILAGAYADTLAEALRRIEAWETLRQYVKDTATSYRELEILKWMDQAEGKPLVALQPLPPAPETGDV